MAHELDIGTAADTLHLRFFIACATAHVAEARRHVGLVDGRSYVAQTTDHFDHIQLSAVDTTAALASGALSLVENSLYTVEAFQDYHDRLSDEGILSITRNFTAGAPLMALRTVDLVREAWQSRGHDGVERHVVVVVPRPGSESRWGTLLASRRPFSDGELAAIRKTVETLGFTILYEPREQGNPAAFEALFGPERERFLRDYPYDVRATTDDKPFFFFFYKPLQPRAGDARFEADQDLYWASRETPRILLQLFGLITILVLLFSFVIPGIGGRLRFEGARGGVRGLLYFAAIGLGFIMVEIPLIQRYTLLLGQPLYAFAGILGCVLVFSGVGSFLSHSIDEERVLWWARWVLFGVIAGVAIHVLWMPSLLRAAMRFEMPARVLFTVATVAPLGLLMGMPLPLGMRLMKQRSPRALAWAWGVNGGLSVLGTVLAMVVSIFFGIAYTLFVAATMYAVALAAFRSTRTAAAA